MNAAEFFSMEPSDPRYPPEFKANFGSLIAPDIWYAGNWDLVDQVGVGFCGSRKASDEGLEVAADCATQLSERNIVVTSGYAAGVDLTSHEAALVAGGSTIVVLAEGIDHFRIKRSLSEHWDWGRILVISYFPPNAVWRPDRAMDRNKAIIALSKAVVVIEAGDTGGTLNAGIETLKANKPLFVAVYGEHVEGRSGNQMLLNSGGVPLLKSRSTGKAHLGRMLDRLGINDHKIGTMPLE